MTRRIDLPQWHRHTEWRGRRRLDDDIGAHNLIWLALHWAILVGRQKTVYLGVDGDP
jgi:hypothetical protein